MTVTEPAQQPAHRPLGRNFRLLWAASAISNLGDGIFLVGLPLLAASITRSPARLSLVVFAGRLPWLLFALVSGALVDRWDRRRVMWMVDAFRFAVVAGLAWAVAADVVTIPLLIIVSFVLGVGETLFDSAAQSIVPAVVGRDGGRLEQANGQMYGAEIVANQFVGPPAGGFLYAAARAVPFVADAVSFAVSLRQSIIPDRLLGRVNSVYRLLAWGTMPIGAAVGGALATAFGLRAAYLIPGVAMVLFPVACARIVTTAAVNTARAEARTGIPTM